MLTSYLCIMLPLDVTIKYILHFHNRSKDRPWFGSTIAGAVTEDQLKWMTALTFAEHKNILPTPRLIIT